MTMPKVLYTLEQPHGLGEVFARWQGGPRALLATTGADGCVAIHDRAGRTLHRLKLPGLCAGMEWDSDGDYLAAISPSSHTVLVWESQTGAALSVEPGLRDAPTALAWAREEPLLAVATIKGNLALYHHHTSKRIPIIGKHAKKITCVAWSINNILVCGSEDKTLSVSGAEGDTLRVISLRDSPADLRFSEMKTDERVAGENTLSLVVGKRTLYLYNLVNPDNPVELAFQQRYGSIVTYHWYGDGYILVGFSAGYVIGISTHIKEVGEELFQVRCHEDTLTDLAVCGERAACCGDGQLKILSVWDGAGWNAALPAASVGGAARLQWSGDGRLLAAAGRGRLAVLLAALPSLASARGGRAAALTSLAEATLYRCVGDEAEEPSALGTFTLPVEPELLALGSSHLGVGCGATAWFLPLGGGVGLVSRRVYRAPLSMLRVGGRYAAALTDGTALLHTIDGLEPSSPEKAAMSFPEPHSADAVITDICLTGDFFIFVTDQGHIEYFSLESWSSCSRARAGSGLVSVISDEAGARVVALGARGGAQVLLGAQGALLPVAGAYRGALWDISLSERNVLVLYTAEALETFYVVGAAARGAQIAAVGATRLPADYQPLLLYNGDVYCLVHGEIVKVQLESHYTEGLGAADGEQRRLRQLEHAGKLIKLRRFGEAWSLCEALDDEAAWRALADAALDELDLHFAIRVYTKLSDVAMVWALEDALNIEDLPTLCGVAAVCLGLGPAAVRWLSGAGPRARPLLLELSGLGAPHPQSGPPHQPAGARALYRRAQHLELTAEYHEALALYEKSLIEEEEEGSAKEHNARCWGGVARCAIRCGDWARGAAAALRPETQPALVKECAALLETTAGSGVAAAAQRQAAAALWERAGEPGRAAALYIQLKSWLKVEALLPAVSSPHVHLQYAKAKEGEGRYAEALRSYLRARDYEAAVRLNLDKLDDVDAAVELVQETKSVRGAKMVADHFQNGDDPASAIKFLVMSLCYDEAFELARKNGKLQLYGEILIQTSQARPDDFRSLALYFEEEKNPLLAGQFYFHAGEHGKALSQLLRAAGGGAGEDQEARAIDLAIDAVAASDDDRLTRRLIEFLLGEADGSPREPRHLFRLYMAKKQFNEAAKTAVIIAGAEAKAGRYREARGVLRASAAALRLRRRPLPRDLARALALLHSYILVRAHVRRGRHELAALLLQRLAEDVAFFPQPQHQVSILTSTVIECARTGMTHAAHRWARELMQPHYRPLIEPKYVKKIESVVRHAPRGPPPPSASAPCPACAAPSPSAALHCQRCQASLPFCLATGLHIVKDDLTACPDCDFPAIASEFVEVAKESGRCPLCEESVDWRRLSALDPAAAEAYLATQQAA